MILWKEPITDRSQEDVERVLYLHDLVIKGNATDEEKTEYATDLKGALNYSDLERITNNITLLEEVLQTGVIIPEIPEIPTESYFLKLLEIVQTIRSSYSVHDYTPQTPTQPLNSFKKWNDIEKILQDVYKILNSNFYYYCGHGLYSGGEIGLLE